jgi:hypothetical protein
MPSTDQTMVHAVLTINSTTAVARGAVLRALNKDNGPDRITGCSYGFLLQEHHRPDLYEAHRGVRPRWDHVDNEKYVRNTILWLIKTVCICSPIMSAQH